MSHLVFSNTNMSFMGTDFGPGLLDHGQLYFENIMEMKRVNQCSNGKVRNRYSKAHIIYSVIYWGNNRGTLIIDSMVQTYTWEGCLDSLNRFDNSASCALSNTPLYSQNRDSWHNVRTVQQMEQECGMILCLAASMIAQYRETIPK
jgi:hypothetical protein